MDSGEPSGSIQMTSERDPNGRMWVSYRDDVVDKQLLSLYHDCVEGWYPQYRPQTSENRRTSSEMSTSTYVQRPTWTICSARRMTRDAP